VMQETGLKLIMGTRICQMLHNQGKPRVASGESTPSPGARL
jgi:hypothetical protein